MKAALELLQTKGVLAVTHGAIGRETGISRSTLYRHWPKLDDLRNAAFARATQGGTSPPPTDGPLEADLVWIVGTLASALNETPWGKIAPQVIGTAAVDDQARVLLQDWINERRGRIVSAFERAIARGEIPKGAPIGYCADIAISVPYFRKCMSGAPLDQAWLGEHVKNICGIASNAN